MKITNDDSVRRCSGLVPDAPRSLTDYWEREIGRMGGYRASVSNLEGFGEICVYEVVYEYEKSFVASLVVSFVDSAFHPLFG